ncbi:MAG: tetratricopeptide repeat protein [Thermodesulfobacteriota bacterium]|nr:tetratricopeptide repeat protein [Thermodesulfobacteriota bacterium]
MRPYHLKSLICLFLIAGTIVVYGQVRNHEFVNYDDPFFVTENPLVQAGLSREGLAWVFTSPEGIYNPVSWLSHMVDCELFGLNPGAHHLTSLLFHILTTLLLFLALNRMTGSPLRSAMVAFLFALHPLNAESVAWVAERRNVLSAFFWMLVLWTYARYAESPSGIRYAAVLLSFIVGLMAKPMLVTLPFVLLLLDYWPLGRLGPGQFSFPRLGRGKGEGARARTGLFGLVLEKVPFFVFSAVFSLMTVFVVAKGAGSLASVEALPPGVRIANALVSYVGYIQKMVWPCDLTVLYLHPCNYPPAWQSAGAVLLLAGISVTVIRAARQAPYLAMGWLWYVGTLVPVIGLVQVGSQSMADRFAYIPLVGLFIIIIWGVADIGAKLRFGRIVLPFFAVAVILALMFSARVQARHWNNSIALFEHAVDVTPRNHVAHVNLGLALTRKGNLEEAGIHYAEAIRLKPGLPKPRYNLATVLARQGRFDEAIAQFSEALRIKPDYAEAHLNLGVAFEQQGRLSDAVFHFSEALRIRPDYARAHLNLAVGLERQGRLSTAVFHYREALRIRPDYAKAHPNLAVFLPNPISNLPSP